MEIRTAQAQDSAAIVRLNEQLGYHATETQIQERLVQMLGNNTYHVLVAQDGDEVVGWLVAELRITLESGSHCEITGLVVDLARRCQGIARKLVQQAETWAAGQGFAILTVRSHINRKEAHHFYPAQDYKTLKVQQVYRKELTQL